MPHRWIRRKVKMHDEARQPLSKFGLWGLVTFLIALIAVGSWVAARSAGRAAGRAASDTARTEVYRQVSAGCARTQLQRGYLRLRANEVSSPTARLAGELFAIVWCEKTYSAGRRRTVLLSKSDQACFLNLERRGYFTTRQPTTDPRKLRPACVTL